MITSNKDTIAAISTPQGEGGIGIVRMSGEDSIAIADRLFFSKTSEKPSSFENRTLHYGYVKTPDKGEVIDEVLLTVMRAPKTYTTEDVVEINCHSGVISLKKILMLCVKEGARLAAPGEFTKRAFLNGRLDLAQAEAVLDMIKSETELSHRVSVEQLRGVFSREVKSLRSSIMETLSLIELGIDFSDEDVEFSNSGKIDKHIKDAYLSIEKLLSSSDKGMFLREGINVVICGKPNTGKSSLMNALLRHDRMIVSPMAGTTRDVVEESLDMGGVKIKLSDTAGITEAQNEVELESIKRSKEKIETCDMAVFMLDNSASITKVDEEIYKMVGAKKVVTVVNKMDLPRRIDIDLVRKRFMKDGLIELSVLERKNIDEVGKEIEKFFLNNIGATQGSPIVTNARHKEALLKAFEAVGRAKDLSGNSCANELAASDLNEAVYWLGFITGESVKDDILDRIFSQFCIGK